MNFVNLHHFSSRDTISQQLLLLLFFFFENEYISTIDGYKEATYFLNLTNKLIIKKRTNCSNSTVQMWCLDTWNQ